MLPDLFQFGGGLAQRQAVSSLLACNSLTSRFALSLTAQQAAQLVETRTQALKETGRVEFGGGVLEKLIREFCDSPYLSQRGYVETLEELTELFYYYKNETLEQLSDEELIAFMKNSFDGKCQGSLDLLSHRELENMARSVRSGEPEEEEDMDEDLSCLNPWDDFDDWNPYYDWGAWDE